MNISGRGYSKATRGLRASHVIKDQHFKLVFTYPMLFDSSVAKYGDVLRDFLATTMLKEIFVSNALKMVSMASQIHPLTDERGDRLHTSPVLSQIIRQENGRFEYETRASRNASDQLGPEVQRKINEKTSVIKQLLNADHKLNQLRPYIEIITMDNMIDVPIIVGTKKFDVHSTPMLMVLIGAITNRPELKLDNHAHVTQIFNKIKDMQATDADTLFNNLLNHKTGVKAKIKKWFLDQNIIKGASGKAKNMRKSLVRRGLLPQIQERPSGVPDISKRTFQMDDSLALLASTQDTMSQAELSFKLVNDPALLKSQYGLSHSNEQISTMTDKMAGPISNVFTNLMNNFVKSLDIVGQPITNSLINIFYPQGSGLDQTKLDDDLINIALLDDVYKLVYSTIRDSILLSFDRSSAEDTDSRIKALKGLCQNTFTDSGDLLKAMNDRMSGNTIQSPSFSENTWHKYNAAIEELGQRGNKQIARVEAALDQIVDVGVISKKAREIFEKGVSNIFTKLDSMYIERDRSDMAIYRNGLNLDADARDSDEAYSRATEQYTANVSSILYFLFMFNLQNALCEFVDVVEVEVETAVNDVTEFPNFSIVLPLESIMAMAAAYRAKNWKTLIQSDGPGQQFLKAMNDNYVKGVIKHMVGRLGVPNVFVIDEKKNTVYYRLMHQTAVQKTNLSTINNFIKLTTQQMLTDTSNKGFY